MVLLLPTSLAYNTKRNTQTLPTNFNTRTILPRQSTFPFHAEPRQNLSEISTMKPILPIMFVAVATIASANDRSNDDAKDPVWINPQKAAAGDRGFNIQGEYYGVSPDGTRYGVQVVATGHLDHIPGTTRKYSCPEFIGVLYEASSKASEDCGLPGLGKDTDTQFVCSLVGESRGNEVLLWLPEGPYEATIRGGKLELYDRSYGHEDKSIAILARIERKSPTLDAKAPDGAVVLFNGTSADAWINGRVEGGLLRGADIRTKQSFRDYQLHLEFRTPYAPVVRGNELLCLRGTEFHDSLLAKAQASGGVCHQGRYETLIRDSIGSNYGQAGPSGAKLTDACAIKGISAPRINACFPPLTWQTYDADFTAARFDGAGRLTQPARITVRLNGVVVHENQALPKLSPGSLIRDITPDAAPLYIQHKDYPVSYRNIWIVPK